MKTKFLFCVFALVHFLYSSPGFSQERSSGVRGKEGSALDRFSEEQRQKLDSGEVVFEYVIENAEGVTEGYGKANILINSPIDECWKIFLEFSKQYEYLPRMTKSRVTESEGDRRTIYKELDFRVYTYTYTHILTVNNKEHRVDFQDAKYEYKPENTKGYFGFEEVDKNTTLFTYVLLKLDLGFNVPYFIKKYLTSKDLPGIAEAVKKRIESGGAWQK